MTFLSQLRLLQELVSLLEIRVEELEKLYSPMEQPAQVEKEGPLAVDNVKPDERKWENE